AVAMLLGATIRLARCRPSRGWGPAGLGATIRLARCRPSRGWGPAGRGATIVERRSAGTEVGAGAERAAGPGHDDRAHTIVGVGALPRLAELADRRRGDGVEAVRSVQRHRADSVLDVVADLGEGHHCSIWNSIRPSAASSLDGGWAGPGTSRSAGMPSVFVSVSRTAATRRSSSSFIWASGSGSRLRTAPSFASPH